MTEAWKERTPSIGYAAFARASASAGAAAIVTVALFLLMAWLVRAQDALEITAPRPATLALATPLPPLAPKLDEEARTPAPGLPAPLARPMLTGELWEGVAAPTGVAETVDITPWTIAFERPAPILKPEATGPNRAIAIRRPAVLRYPELARNRGIDGWCEVRFDVNPYGRPINISARCTDPVFELEARRAVGRAKFQPALEKGVPVTQRDVVYPLGFFLRQFLEETH